jgi:N-acetylmuramoyl-L-alanine amidase
MKKASYRDTLARGIAEGIAKYQADRRAGRLH